jgi:hypothetical protein
MKIGREGRDQLFCCENNYGKDRSSMSGVGFKRKKD